MASGSVIKFLLKFEIFLNTKGLLTKASSMNVKNVENNSDILILFKNTSSLSILG